MLDADGTDLPERLLTHYVGGLWRAPLGTQMCAVPGRDGRMLGQVVCASPADLARAQALHQPHPDRALFGAVVHDHAGVLAQMLARVMHNAPDQARLIVMARSYARTGIFAPDLHLAPDILMPRATDALLCLSLALLAQRAGAQAGMIALLHAPLSGQMNRVP